MKKIVDWINSHKVITVCIVLFLLVVQPFFVHLFLKIPAPSPFFERDWNAGDLITYIAGFEAFIGTVFLGIVAVRQNDKANDLNQRMLDNEELHCKYERQPSIMILGASREVLDAGKPDFIITLDLVNVSKVYTQFRFEELRIGDAVGTLTKSSPIGDGVFQKAAIGELEPQKHSSFTLELRNHELQRLLNYPCYLKFRMLNSLAEKYTENVTFSIVFETNNSISLSEFVYNIQKE